MQHNMQSARRAHWVTDQLCGVDHRRWAEAAGGCGAQSESPQSDGRGSHLPELP